MKKPYNNIEFDKKIKKRSPLAAVIIICASVLLVGTAVFFLLLQKNNFSLEKLLGARTPAEESTGEAATSNNTTPADEGKVDFSDENSVNILFLCNDSHKNITFCEVVNLALGQGIIRIKPVSTGMKATYKGRDYTLNDLYGAFSVNALIEVLKEKDIDINRYICVDETSFKMMLQRLGAVEITVENEVQYRVDAITYTLTVGTHSLTSDALLKYMKYAGLGEDALSIQGNAFACLIAQHFTSQNLNKGESFFAELINLTKSDISAFDYADNKDVLCRFLDTSPKINVVC